MKKILPIIFILVAFFSIAHAGDYKCSIVGNAGGNGLVIAQGRNDGINRLYSSGKYPYEFSWNGAGWTKDTMSAYPCYPRTITAGFGRNDNICRIFTGDDSRGAIKEYSFDGSTWDSMVIKAGNWEGIRTVEIGNIKNDDTMRVVAGCDDSTTIAYTYEKGSGAWKRDTLGIKRSIVQDIVIGKGRNDDTNRVYSSGDIYWIEYIYRDKWDTTHHQFTVNTGGKLLGALKDDGLQRLYIKESGIHEIEWDGTQWLRSDSAIAYGTYPFSGNGRNDGKQRMYTLGSSMVIDDSIFSDIRIYEWSYNVGQSENSMWDKKVLDTIALNYGYNFDMAAGVVGDARNDGKNRVYALSELGVIYEWEWDDSLNGVVAEPVTSDRVFSLQLNQNYPNPFNQSTVISYQFTGKEPVKLAVYNIAGQLVKTLINNPSPNALGEGRVRSITWDGRDSQGKPVISGLYFYCLEVGGARRTKKMVLLK